ncbi:MAG TPA: Gfo/Idh/MocA family oxidoreductase [Candidatus Solibacter sp.]|nr:Gfo/Idh/MocA family oxidoreductase [Candidatus Solibacter sp.]
MKTRVAVAGLGSAADRIHLPACRAVAEIELVAAADPDSALRTKMGSKFAIPKVFADIESMLSEVKPDVLTICTPPATHFEICRKALMAGVHVFCEKPFMSTVEQADQIIAIAREKRLALRVNNQYRYMTFYADAKRRIAAGEFGAAYSIDFWQHMFHPPSAESNWRGQMQRYLIYEFGTHPLDLACFFFDGLPVSIQAHTPKCRPEFTSDVLVRMTARFPGERIATFSFNRISHAPGKYLESRIDCRDASIRISLGGVARFKLEWSREARRPVAKFGLVKGGQSIAERNGRPKTLLSSKEPEFASATAQHLRAFLSETQEPAPPLDAAEHSREVLRAVFAAYESAESGETVWLRKGVCEEGFLHSGGR